MPMQHSHHSQRREKRSEYDQVPETYDGSREQHHPPFAPSSLSPLFGIEREQFRSGRTGSPDGKDNSKATGITSLEKEISQTGQTEAPFGDGSTLVGVQDRTDFFNSRKKTKSKSVNSMLKPNSRELSRHVSDVTNLLELEEETPENLAAAPIYGKNDADADLLGIGCEPVRTKSGLLLTHRKNSTYDSIGSTPPRASSDGNISSNMRRPSMEQIDFRDLRRGSIHKNSSNRQSVLEGQGNDAANGNINSTRRYAASSGVNIPSRNVMQVEDCSSSLSVSRWRRRVPRSHAFSDRHGGAFSSTPTRSYGSDHYYDDHDTCSVFTLKGSKRVFFSYVKMWVVAFFALLALGSGIACVAIKHSRLSKAARTQMEAKTSNSMRRTQYATDESEATSALSKFQNQAYQTGYENKVHFRAPNFMNVADAVGGSSFGVSSNNEHHISRLEELREAFGKWADHHRRDYGSHDEKERRFHIWAENHEKIRKANERHGPCKKTGQPVFGTNHFQDLTSDEFKSRFLTGYNAELHDHKRKGKKKDQKLKKEIRVMTLRDPVLGVDRHPSIQRKYLQHWVTHSDASPATKKRYVEHAENLEKASASSGLKQGYTSISLMSCWNICEFSPSCWLNCLLGYSLGGTMNPKNNDVNPSSLDWRNFGVVTDVHSQGSCGACWAFTAVETVESVYAIYSGNLINLAETEVIVCDDSCQMCNGGWPQNAYEYVMKHRGLPAAQGDLTYDGDFLMEVTNAAMSGQSDSLSESDVQYYQSQICSNAQSGSGKSGDNNNYYNGNQQQRYGSIKGYGYATDKCVCYTNGSGCDCDSQNEALAVRNVASYGPAVVCVDATVWQYYQGGIMTSSSGCSQKFLDMNHCVQAVGFAFTDDEEDDGDQGDQQQNSRSNKSNKSGDNQEREGYWIIRNQWSNRWGINGYAYVAMGENTCGVLNDMTQAYMKN